MQPSSDTTRPRPGEELDAARIQGFLRQSLPEFAGPSGTLRIRQFPGGASNLTYLLQSGDRELVYRFVEGELPHVVRREDADEAVIVVEDRVVVVVGPGDRLHDLREGRVDPHMGDLPLGFEYVSYPE